jgi:hypothetical protein
MGEPDVVQGVVVVGEPPNNPPPTSQDNNNDGNNTVVKGEKQESKCRDPIFALLMYGNVIAVIVTVIVLNDEAFLVLDTNTVSADNYEGFFYAALICSVVAMILSVIMLQVMMRIPSFLIKTSLIVGIVMSIVWTIVGFLRGNLLIGVCGIAVFLFGSYYAISFWSHIPFFTANLVTGCTAIRGNVGVIVATYLFDALAFGWTLLWCLACFATLKIDDSCTQNVYGKEVCDQDKYGYLLLLLISYYFTHQVIQNTVHVIVAGTVGSWWFSSEDSGCCSPRVSGATIRYVCAHTHHDSFV